MATYNRRYVDGYGTVEYLTESSERDGEMYYRFYDRTRNIFSDWWRGGDLDEMKQVAISFFTISLNEGVLQ